MQNADRDFVVSAQPNGHPGDEILWTSGFFNERFPAPISPLGWSLIGPLIEELALRDPLRYLGYPHAATIPLTRLWHGHPYANALAFQILYKVFPDSILPEDASRYFPNGDTSLRKRAPYPRWSDTLRVVFALLRAFLSDPFNVSPLNNYRHWAKYTHEHDARVAGLRARVGYRPVGDHPSADTFALLSTWFTLSPSALLRTDSVEGLKVDSGVPLRNVDSREIFAALEETKSIHRALLRIHRWSLMDADLTFGLLKRLVRMWVDREHANDIAARLVADVPNKTTEVDQALREMTNDKLQMSNEKFQAFLAEHGHRSFSLDIAVPTFADDPEQVLRLLMTADNRPPTTGNVKSEQPVVVSRLRSAVIRIVLSLARPYIAMREDQRYYWQKSLAVSRHLYLLLADRLVLDAVIADRNAVFFAMHQELVDYFKARLTRDALAQSVAARQAEWQEYRREFEQSPTTSYPSFLRGDQAFVGDAGASIPYKRQWRGRAVSPGIGRGVARVVQSASELARIQRGEILIAPATDPAWTPVFARIAGLVVERGGVLSHSAVIAREYQVPAVAGIPNIVAEIHDGEMIEVDGRRGIVRIVQ